MYILNKWTSRRVDSVQLDNRIWCVIDSTKNRPPAISWSLLFSGSVLLVVKAAASG